MIPGCLILVLAHGAAVAQDTIVLTEAPEVCGDCIGVERVAALGGDHDGDDLLTRGVYIFRGPTGRTYVHDFGAGASEIFFYTPEGDLEFIIGKRGEGPGEFAEPSAIAEMPNGRLAVFDHGLFRLSILEADGAYLDSSRFPGRVSEVLPLSDSVLLVNASIPTRRQAGLPLHLVHIDGTIIESFGPEVAVLPGAEDVDWRSLAVLEGGRFLTISMSAGPYRVELWDGLTPVSVRTRETPWLSRESPFSPSVVGTYLEGDRLWVLVRTPDPNWTPLPPSAPGVRRHFDAQYQHDNFDTVIEVIDLTRNEVVASQRFDEFMYRVFGDGTAVRQTDNELGLPVYEILKLRMRPSGSDSGWKVPPPSLGHRLPVTMLTK